MQFLLLLDYDIVYQLGEDNYLAGVLAGVYEGDVSINTGDEVFLEKRTINKHNKQHSSNDNMT